MTKTLHTISRLKRVAKGRRKNVVTVLKMRFIDIGVGDYWLCYNY